MGPAQCMLGQHLDRNSTPQRDLLGFVHDTHSAARDLPNNPVIAKLFDACLFRSRCGGSRTLEMQLFDRRHRRKQGANLLGVLRIHVCIVVNRHALTTSQSVGEIPSAADPAFADEVARWERARGVRHEFATLRATLAGLERPGEGTRRLLAARDVAELARDRSPEGRWLAELARWLLGHPEK